MHRYSLLEHLLFPPTYLNKQKLHDALDGKTILITGATFGIGEKLANILADFNVELILVARTEEKLLSIKNELENKSARISIFQADLRNTLDVEKLLTFLHQLPGGLDIFVNNAGKSILRSIYNSLDRYHDFTRTMALNYFAPVQLMLSLIPLLQKKKGHVINISTVNALLIPLPYWAAYQASKSAFDTWFRSVSPELNENGISTTSFYLPLVKTRMIEPTKAYRNMPAMCPNHVALSVCKSMYTKKHTYKPWWLVFGQLASIIFRRPWDCYIPMTLKKGEASKDV